LALRKDIWRVGVVMAPMRRILERGDLAGEEIAWLPTSSPLTYLADPFGVWRDGRLHMFVEAYDYRTRRGVIEVLTFDEAFRTVDRQLALSEPWHLSYPTLVETDGETYMLPEAHRSGRLTLYRAADFPVGWERVCEIELDSPAIDASPVFFEGRWWLFYAPSGGGHADRTSTLHVAFADRLTGPWRPHPGNPVWRDPASARPGGTPIVADGVLIAPMQDCTRTYGGAIRPLRITRLDPDGFEAEPGYAISAPGSFGPYVAGLHTMSACGPVTLIDAKRIETSLRGLALDVRRGVARALAGTRT
jgi:hypothetical protein